jgi:Kef-type K+ transport system membrane component KefB
MSEAIILLTLGGLFLLGLAADIAGRHSPLPRVTLLLLAGVVVGPAGFGILGSEFVADWFPTLTNIALAMIGFLLGQKLTLSELRGRGQTVLSMAGGKIIGAALAVSATLIAMGVDIRIALLLAGIATATDPIATYEVVREIRARGEFSDTLLSVVAIDDAWALLLFTLLLAVASTLGAEPHAMAALASGLIEIGASVLLGLGLGIPMAYLTGRVHPGEPTQAEAVGLVLLCSGAAIWFGVSPILAAMVMGSAVANLASHHNRPFEAIEGIEWPFMMLFFILAGASLQVEALAAVGWIGGAYVVARAFGTYAGIHIAGRLIGADDALNRWLGLTLFPQAGVALGTALVASQRFPELADTLLTVVLASTVLLELLGPVITRRVLVHVGARR